ncbi:MAG: leucine-rich repeat protein [Bacteroidetes bacterium]|nr:leucine-rich repeat protein [Bacteroidota bacterium]
MVSDFYISGIGTFYYNGSLRTVTITPKYGSSDGTITVKYNGNTTAPSAVGTYTVTFDVAATANFNAASGLSAGTLKIVDGIFTNFDDLYVYLQNRPANTASNPYIVALNVNDVRYFSEDTGIGTKLNELNKYVSIDMSNSTYTYYYGYDYYYNYNWSSAFSGCTNLTSITLPNYTKSISHYAFSDCTSLTSITIPSGIESMGYRVFYGCTSLTAINVDNNKDDSYYGNYYYSDQGVLYEAYYEKIELIKYPAGKIGAFTIPDSVTSMGDEAFIGCENLTSVTIGSNVTTIRNAAFSDCTGLTSITIPEEVTRIENSAFYGCTSLTSVTFQGMITSSNFSNDNPFPGDLRAKYMSGLMGTYKRTPDSDTWTKQ